MTNNKILPKHKDKADDELACVVDSLDIAKEFATRGNYKSAMLRVEEVNRSLKSLQDMQDMYIDAYTIKPQDVSDYE